MSPGPGPPHFTITTSDCETLDALWAPVDAAHGKAILYLHGNAANLCSRETRIRALTELGFSVLAIDWRGYGKSTGSPSQEGLQLDAEAALDWLSRRIDLSNVVVLAESIATGVAVELVAKHQVRALVLEAPYFSAVSLAEAFLPFFPVRALMLDHFRSDLWIVKTRAHLLVQHGRRDFTVPFRQGERLYAIAPHPKRFIAYPRGGHYDLPEKHNSYRDLKEFLDECFRMN